MGWMYFNSSRLKKDEALLAVILNNQRDGTSFIISERRYRLVDDEVVEVVPVNLIIFFESSTH